MGEQHQIAADLVNDRAGWTTDVLKNLNTGRMFTAEIDGSPSPEIMLTELGEDYRNVILLHVTSDADADGIIKGHEILLKLFGRTCKAQILKRRDNIANAQNEFWAMQLTNKDT